MFELCVMRLKQFGGGPFGSNSSLGIETRLPRENDLCYFIKFL